MATNGPWVAYCQSCFREFQVWERRPKPTCPHCRLPLAIGEPVKPVKPVKRRDQGATAGPRLPGF